MAVNVPSANVHSASQRIIAFFRNKEDASRALSELKNAGFTANEIGLMARSDRAIDTASSNIDLDEGFWDKLKHFFSGESSDDVDYRDSASGMNWDQKRADYYYRGIGQGGALVSVTGPRIEEARPILQNAGGDLRETGFETASPSGGTEASGPEQDYRIQLRGEVLRTFKERVERGEVRLRKEVVTENKTVEVPVTREELVVERVPVSGQEAAKAGEIGSDKEIRVPLSEERARVEKQPIVSEEVRVGKRAVQKTERVSEDVRHEELRVDKQGDVEVDTRGGQKGKKPAA
jgi:uncharacterized protein (TIGR02271 family)